MLRNFFNRLLPLRVVISSGFTFDARLFAQDAEPIAIGEVILGPVDSEFDIPQIGDATAPISDPSATDQETPEVDLSTPGTTVDSDADAGLQPDETEGDGRSSQSLTAMTSSTGEEEVLEQRVPTRKDPQVDEATGAFTYSVPITVPAFRGLEPKLAFTYSSSGLLRGRPDSYSGLNWKLSGLSVIERRSIGGGIAAFDDDLDVYMLDGMPLLACKSGQKDVSAPTPQIIANYPSDYKAATTSASCLAGGNLTSKREDYRKIERVPATSVNTVGNTGPNGETLYNFKVYDKDGTVYLYKSIGELANLSSAMSWTDSRFNSVFFRRYILTEVYDSQRFSSGPNYPNRVSYIYGFSSLPNGLAERPVEIRYAGNDTDNTGGYRILFGYDTTTFPLSTFGVGNETMFGSQNRLLRSIRVMRDSNRIRAYKIEYVNGTLIDNTWLPSSITELGVSFNFDGTTGKVNSIDGNAEMPPVTFKYNNDVPQVERVLHSNGTANADYQFTSYPSFFDFDGDGRSEVAFIESLGNVDSKYPDASSHVIQLDPLAQNEPRLKRYSQINIDYVEQYDAYVLGFTSEKRSLNGFARYFLWGPTWGPPGGCHPFLIRRRLDGSASGAFDGPGGCARPAIVAELDGDLDPEALVEGDPYYLNLSSANVDPIAKVQLPFSVD